MSRRSYSDADKATALAALDANGGNVKRTASQLNIPHKTLDDWAHGRKLHPAVAELRTVKKGALADKFENLAHHLLDAMPEKIQKATLSQCAVTAGIAVDKAKILRGEELYDDPAAEICRIMGITRKQLPTSLSLDGCSQEDRDFIVSELNRYAEEDGIDLSLLLEPGAIEMNESGPSVYAPVNSESNATRPAHMDPVKNQTPGSGALPPPEKTTHKLAPRDRVENQAPRSGALPPPEKRTHGLDPRFFPEKPPPLDKNEWPETYLEIMTRHAKGL